MTRLMIIHLLIEIPLLVLLAIGTFRPLVRGEAMCRSASNTKRPWRHWRWVAPAVVASGGALIVTTPHLPPAWRLAGLGLLPVVLVMGGYGLYLAVRPHPC